MSQHRGKNTPAHYKRHDNTSTGSYADVFKHSWEPKEMVLAWISAKSKNVVNLRICEKGVADRENTYQNGPIKPQIWRTNVMKTPMLADSCG